MEKERAEQFAHEWIAAWNSHDLEAIISHYDEEVEFHSPFIVLLKFNDSGVIRSKKELKQYFNTGLSAYPDLHFQLHHCLVGLDTVVIYYTSVNNRLAAEVLLLNEQGKATKVYCHYASK